MHFITPSRLQPFAIFWFLLITSSVLSYGQSRFQVPYRQDSAISDRTGRPVRSTTWYFPANRFIDSSAFTQRVSKNRITKAMLSNSRYDVIIGYKDGRKDTIVYEPIITARVDTFKLNWFSYYLFRFKEPVLHNYPLGKEVYRLTWLRSFHRPVIVRLEKKGTTIRLTTKMLSRNPQLPGHQYMDADDKNRPADTSSIPFRINRRRKISGQAYRKFVQLLAEKQALSISPLGLRHGFGLDGSEWILESHRPEGYYFVTRWSPKETQALRVLGDYLLDLSAAKTQKRY